MKVKTICVHFGNGYDEACKSLDYFTEKELPPNSIIHSLKDRVLPDITVLTGNPETSLGNNCSPGIMRTIVYT
jgi:hypothetical protein